MKYHSLPTFQGESGLQMSPKKRWHALFEKMVILTLSKEVLCLTNDLFDG